MIRWRMLGRTHITGGMASLWVLAAVPHGLDPIGLCFIFAVVGAQLPDLDSPASLLQQTEVLGGKPLWKVGPTLSATLGHRGPLHSVGFLYIVTVGVGVPLAALLGWQVPAALALGYASHLALDMCTVSGLRVLWPFTTRTYWLVPREFRVRTQSPMSAEELPWVKTFSLASLALAVFELLRSIPSLP